MLPIKISFQIKIIFLFVDEQYRNKIASKLIEFVLTDIKGSISVDTNISNKIAIKFYKKNNFKIKQK